MTISRFRILVEDRLSYDKASQRKTPSEFDDLHDHTYHVEFMRFIQIITLIDFATRSPTGHSKNSVY